MAQFTPPDKFQFLPDQWLPWLCEFNGFRIAAKLDDESDSRQITQLMYCMGMKTAQQIFSTFKYGKKTVQTEEGTEEKDESATCYEDVVKKFTDYFVVKVNIRHERFKFQSRKQLIQSEKSTGPESAEEFLRELQRLIQTCDYPDQDDQLLDRFVLGLRDGHLSKRLQLKSDLTLEEAFRIVRQAEQVEKQTAEQNQQKNESVDAVKQPYRKPRGKYQAQPRNNHSFSQPRNTQPHTDSCGNCGRSHPSQRCPAAGKTCNYCKKVGHFINVCRKRKGKASKADEVDQSMNLVQQSSHTDTLWLDSVRKVPDSPPWLVKLNLCGSDVTFKIDTGADITLLSTRSYDQLAQKPPLAHTDAKLMSPGGAVPCRGEFVASVHFKSKEYNFRVIVADYQNNLLSRNVASEMGTVLRIDAANVANNSDIFWFVWINEYRTSDNSFERRC